MNDYGKLPYREDTEITEYNLCFFSSFFSTEISYYILLLRIVNANFTDELKDKSSSEFKDLQANITTEVSYRFFMCILLSLEGVLELRCRNVNMVIYL